MNFMKLKPKMLLGIGVPLVVIFIIMGVAINMIAAASQTLASLAIELQNSVQTFRL